jgi:hypothetical protein
MHFLSPAEKNNLKNGIFNATREYKGLELKFDLDITPVAEIEVILDRETGHGMKATKRVSSDNYFFIRIKRNCHNIIKNGC